MSKQFWSWVKAEHGNELILDGVISESSWYEDEVTPKMFREQLAERSGNITVRINSPGGDVFSGVSIYNMLNEHEGYVTVKVDGIAASIASLIAMAGDKIIMLPGSQMLVHQPWTIAAGNSDDLGEVISMLEKTCESMVPIYAERTGLSEEKILELLKGDGTSDGTLMTATEAVELGFADEAVVAKSKTNALSSISEVLAGMQSAVMQPVMSIQTRKAEQDDAEHKEPAEVVTEESEAPSTEVEQADEEVEQETETAEVTEPAVEEEKESVDKETKAMSKEIAESQVMEPKAQAAVDATPKVDAKAWFKSKASVVALTEALEANVGKSFASEEVQAAYKAAQVKAGLTDPSVFTLPEPLVTAIEDAVKSGEIYSRMNHTGLDIYKVLWDDTDANADTSRAGGFNGNWEDNESNVDRTKEEQVLDFDDRVIRAQYIYKYLVLGKEVIRENRSTGALVRFVLNELPVRIIRELERAAIIGDGRANNSKRKITSFVSVKADAATSGGAGNAFASTFTRTAGMSLAEAVRRAAAEIEADGEIVLIAKKGFAVDAQFERDSSGDLLFPVGTSAEAVLGVRTIIEPSWFNDTTDPDNDAYLVVLSKYYTVGDNSVEAFTNFQLETNEQEFLQEIYKGGALAAPKAAVAISAEAAS